jgi:uncharacterized membrane protein
MSRAWSGVCRFVNQPGFIVAEGIRTWRERVAQTLWYEGIGLLLVSPLYAWASGSGGSESLMLLATLSLVVMAWAALYNTLFDLVERRCTGRVASDRSRGVRTVHAIGLESSAVLLTCPVILVMTNSSLAAALLANLGLTAIYAVYGYAFHWAYDRLRPVDSAAAERVCAEGPRRAR